MPKKRLIVFIVFLAVIVSAGAGTLRGNVAPDSITVVRAEESKTVSEGDASDADGAEYVQSAIKSDDIVSEETASEEIVVALDAGHGGEDEGCSREGINEKDINLSIALKVEKGLEESGYQVVMTREKDEAVELEERVEISEMEYADAYISIHQNASEEAGVSGIETWYDVNYSAEGSKRLAQLIQKYTVSSTGCVDRGIIEDDSIKVVRENIAPSCLVETGFLSNEEERESLLTEEYQEKIAEGIVNAVEMFFHPKTMYLTFDDGPSEENTNRVLDILDEHNIKATFFLVGENVEKYPETAKRIAQEGHSIGIHCYSHNYNSLYESTESYIEDFEKAREVIYEITGVESNIFRFPGGSINSYNQEIYRDIIDEMTDMGYVYYDWNASLEDAVKGSTPEQLVYNARASTLGRSRIIMLGHDVVYNTTLCLDELIESFPEYRMEAVTEEVEPIIFKLD
ncbi:MAG: N-acetylmuramoyl-L-alanine amidase [Lachnospiraceae bacterium]|nr:N-acetylmuramoyl-L-alanine amidase [Lachnospiraceae bacterium]